MEKELTFFQKQVDAMTRGMLASFDDPVAIAARKAIKMSDDEARKMIEGQRQAVGLPPMQTK